MNIGDVITTPIKIESDGIYTKISVDGKQIPRVRNYELSQSVGEIPTLTVEIMPDIKQIELDGEVVFKYYDIDGNELALKK